MRSVRYSRGATARTSRSCRPSGNVTSSSAFGGASRPKPTRNQPSFETRAGPPPNATTELGGTRPHSSPPWVRGPSRADGVGPRRGMRSARPAADGRGHGRSGSGRIATGPRGSPASRPPVHEARSAVLIMRLAGELGSTRLECRCPGVVHSPGCAGCWRKRPLEPPAPIMDPAERAPQASRNGAVRTWVTIPSTRESPHR